MSAKATRSTGNTIHHSLLSDLVVIFSFVPDSGAGLCCFVVWPLELSVAMGAVSAGSLTEGSASGLWCECVTAGIRFAGTVVTFGVAVCFTTTMGSTVVANFGASVFAAVVAGAGAAGVVFTVSKAFVVCWTTWGVAGTGTVVAGSAGAFVVFEGGGIIAVVAGVAGAAGAGANVVSDETGVKTWTVASRSRTAARTALTVIFERSGPTV